MAGVELVRVGKTFPNGFCALAELSLSVADGEFLVLVGPSGCGKSTVLNLIAGLEQCTAGEVTIGDRVVTDEPSKRRDVAMVFQDYALYPHMTVARNIGFPLELAKAPKSEIAQRVGDAARILGLEGQLSSKPGQLSGGQKQRVAMGRAIVRRPSVFLMDEPLSNLDAKLRVQMRSEIARLQRELGVTTIYVTHDQVEAMTMGDRVAVMLDGKLQQLDTPQQLYRRPANMFVAGFIGSPPMNLVRAQVDDGADGAAVVVGGTRVPLGSEIIARCPELRSARAVGLGVRPEHLRPARPDEPGIPGTVALVESLGAELLVHVGIEATPLSIADAVIDERAREELSAALPSAPGGGATTVIARLSPDETVAAGDSLRWTFDTQRLHFFDIRSGLALAGS